MRLSIALAFLLTLVACGQRDTPKAQSQEGRAETRSIRNTDTIGYDGAAIANKVDAALDANDERKKRLDAEMDREATP